LVFVGAAPSLRATKAIAARTIAIFAEPVSIPVSVIVISNTVCIWTCIYTIALVQIFVSLAFCASIRVCTFPAVRFAFGALPVVPAVVILGALPPAFTATALAIRLFQVFASLAFCASIRVCTFPAVRFARSALPVVPAVIILGALIPTFTATGDAIRLFQVFAAFAFLAIASGGTLSAVCLAHSAILTVLVIQAPTLVPIVELPIHMPSIVGVTTVLTPRVVIPASVVLRVVALILSEMLISIFTICFSSCGFSHQKLDSAADPRNRLHSIGRRWLHGRRLVVLICLCIHPGDPFISPFLSSFFGQERRQVIGRVLRIQVDIRSRH
jgi:hypothetical protein